MSKEFATMSIATYVRTSLKNDNHCADSQRAEIQKWLHAEGIGPDQVNWYVDVDAGSKSERSAFRQLQAEIDRGDVD